MSGWDPPQRNIASQAVEAYYPHLTPAVVMTLANQILSMITEYHLTCTTRGTMTTSPIVSETVEETLPLLADYDCPDCSGHTDMWVQDHKAHSLRVAVWLQWMDMTHGQDRGASESLLWARHPRSPLLSYFLAPGTGNLSHEEVVDRVLQENQVAHDSCKQRSMSSLRKSHTQRTQLLGELDDLDKKLEGPTSRKSRQS